MKFEVEFGRSNAKPRLLEREVFIISMFVILFLWNHALTVVSFHF